MIKRIKNKFSMFFNPKNPLRTDKEIAADDIVIIASQFLKSSDIEEVLETAMNRLLVGKRHIHHNPVKKSIPRTSEKVVDPYKKIFGIDGNTAA
jgi:hypothetical protein